MSFGQVLLVTIAEGVSGTVTIQRQGFATQRCLRAPAIVTLRRGAVRGIVPRQNTVDDGLDLVLWEVASLRIGLIVSGHVPL